MCHFGGQGVCKVTALGPVELPMTTRACMIQQTGMLTRPPQILHRASPT